MGEKARRNNRAFFAFASPRVLRRNTRLCLAWINTRRRDWWWHEPRRQEGGQCMVTFFVLASIGLLALFGLFYVAVSWLVASPRPDSRAAKRVFDLKHT
jgi:hypothetical protein